MLVHPGTGLVFAFAGGTGMYGFRVPLEERYNAQLAKEKWLEGRTNLGSNIVLEGLNSEWASLFWYNDAENCCFLAYNYAGTLRS